MTRDQRDFFPAFPLCSGLREFVRQIRPVRQVRQSRKTGHDARSPEFFLGIFAAAPGFSALTNEKSEVYYFRMPDDETAGRILSSMHFHSASQRF